MKHWVPQQHGAWAMLIVPFVLGLVAASTANQLGWAHLVLGLFWFLGYFTFNAASGWLKAAQRKKARYFPPLVTFGALAVVAGCATLALAGIRILPWTLCFIPLVLPALWLAAHRNERATFGGFLTVVAASLMLPVARYLYPSDWNDWPQVFAETWLTFGYFFGTVLFVKTNIRQRGSRAYLIASAGFHLLLFASSVLLMVGGQVALWWVPILFVILVRALILPPLRLRPIVLGVSEICICLVILGCATLS